MTAIRLARGFTGRNKILKFQGCYHGHSDSLLADAGSGLMTLNLPASAGVLAAEVADTHTIAYNDVLALAEFIAQYPDQLAAIIVEPIAANMNLVLPEPGFLASLRAAADKTGAVLIFDEVITGFRVALGGASALYGVRPDLICLGKIIGGGLPVGALGGRADIMRHLAPEGPVYQAGTMSGNPIVLAAGLAVLRYLMQEPAHAQLALQTQYLQRQLTSLFAAKVKVEAITGLFGLKFIADPEHKYFKRFFNLCLEQGIYLAPSPYEAGFLSLAHDFEILDLSLEKFASVIAKI